MKSLLTFPLLLLAVCTSLFAQPSFAPAPFESPRFTGLEFGVSAIDELLPEGVPYTPFTMLGSFSVWQKGRGQIYGEGQLTQAINSFTLKTDYEFGMNLGFRYRLPLSPKTSFSAAIGSGPHYITVETRRQARGFIFSDNIELGFHQYVPSEDLQLNIKARYRHISNAGLKSPNGGIDNMLIVVGVSKYWR